jgi:hypothetical protein
MTDVQDGKLWNEKIAIPFGKDDKYAIGTHLGVDNVTYDAKMKKR